MRSQTLARVVIAVILVLLPAVNASARSERQDSGQSSEMTWPQAYEAAKAFYDDLKPQLLGLFETHPTYRPKVDGEVATLKLPIQDFAGSRQTVNFKFPPEWRGTIYIKVRLMDAPEKVRREWRTGLKIDRPRDEDEDRGRGMTISSGGWFRCTDDSDNSTPGLYLVERSRDLWSIKELAESRAYVVLTFSQDRRKL